MTDWPAAVERYLDDTVTVLRDILGRDLVGIHPTGSLALGGFRPGRSDIDLMAVVSDDTSLATREKVAARLDHAVHPVPATGLELVLYPRATVTAPSVHAGFVLNFNTGAELPSKTDFDPGDEPAFWYVIDRSITYQCNETLYGPEPRDYFAPVPAAALIHVLVSAVEVQTLSRIDLLDNAVLNGCRALRYGMERRWSTKEDAGRWVAAALPDYDSMATSAVSTYGQDRSAGNSLPETKVHAFLEHVLLRLRGIADREGAGHV